LWQSGPLTSLAATLSSVRRCNCRLAYGDLPVTRAGRLTVESWSNERIRWHPGERKEFVVYMTIIEIRPHRWSWKVFEAQGVDPVFPVRRQAIN